MLRVLCVLPKYVLCGGIESYAYNYYKYLDVSKCKMDFIAHEMVDLEYIKKIESRGGRTYLLPQFSLKNLLILFKKMDDFFSQHRGEYDIIHCHMANAAGFYFLIAQKHGISACILHSHQSQAADSIFHCIRNKPLLWYARYKANCYMACSTLAGDFLYGCHRYILINNAIEIDRFAYNVELRSIIRSRLNIENKYVIGHVGRFSTQKNHKRLVEIFTKVREKRNDAMLLLVGVGETMENIKELVKNNNLGDYVIFYGSSNEVEKLYQAMDVLVMPSFYEGLPVVAVEAQASGLPCVLSSAITKEVNISGNVKFVNLKEKDEVWVDCILQKVINTNRVFEKKCFVNRGYDIESASNKLIEHYEKLLIELRK